ncbi:MAG: hypothetical protein MHM6MM_006734 [Cercozoa sp. M6MM]
MPTSQTHVCAFDAGPLMEALRLEKQLERALEIVVQHGANAFFSVGKVPQELLVEWCPLPDDIVDRLVYGYHVCDQSHEEADLGLSLLLAICLHKVAECDISVDLKLLRELLLARERTRVFSDFVRCRVTEADVRNPVIAERLAAVMQLFLTYTCDTEASDVLANAAVLLQNTPSFPSCFASARDGVVLARTMRHLSVSKVTEVLDSKLVDDCMARSDDGVDAPLELLLKRLPRLDEENATRLVNSIVALRKRMCHLDNDKSVVPPLVPLNTAIPAVIVRNLCDKKNVILQYNLRRVFKILASVVQTGKFRLFSQSDEIRAVVDIAAGYPVDQYAWWQQRFTSWAQTDAVENLLFRAMRHAKEPSEVDLLLDVVSMLQEASAVLAQHSPECHHLVAFAGRESAPMSPDLQRSRTQLALALTMSGANCSGLALRNLRTTKAWDLLRPVFNEVRRRRREFIETDLVFRDCDLVSFDVRSCIADFCGDRAFLSHHIACSNLEQPPSTQKIFHRKPSKRAQRAATPRY